MVETEQAEPKVEKKSWETPRLAAEGKVSEITAAISATDGPGSHDIRP